MDVLKQNFKEIIQNYISEKIVYAQEAMVRNGLSLLKLKKNTVMVFGSCQAIEKLFETAHKEGAKFKVIIVDTCPEFTGRDQVKRLAAAGIKCKYTLL